MLLLLIGGRTEAVVTVIAHAAPYAAATKRHSASLQAESTHPSPIR